MKKGTKIAVGVGAIVAVGVAALVLLRKGKEAGGKGKEAGGKVKLEYKTSGLDGLVVRMAGAMGALVPVQGQLAAALAQQKRILGLLDKEADGHFQWMPNPGYVLRLALKETGQAIFILRDILYGKGWLGTEGDASRLILRAKKRIDPFGG